MANLTADIPTVRYGDPGNASQPLQFGIAANVTVYRGSIALTRGGFLTPAQNSGLQATDVAWGVVGDAGPGFADTGPGIAGSSTAGGVTAQVETGCFFLASSTGADQLGVTTLGKQVFVYDEQTVAATSASNARPAAGTHIYTDTTRTDSVGPYAIVLGSNTSSGAP